MKLFKGKSIRYDHTKYDHTSNHWLGNQKWLIVTTIAAALAATHDGLSLSPSAIAQPFAETELVPIQVAQASPTVTYPVLAIGSTSETVSQLQATLKLLGFYQGAVDGTYSESTQAAVTRFQIATGLAADGIAGAATWRKLLPSPEDVAIGNSQPDIATPPADVSPTVEPTAESTAEEPVEFTVETESPAADVLSGPPTLRPNVEGSAVAQLQRELTQLGYYSGPIDGEYGELTQAAVKQFQVDQQLEVDAVVGPSTWDALTRELE